MRPFVACVVVGCSTAVRVAAFPGCTEVRSPSVLLSSKTVSQIARARELRCMFFSLSVSEQADDAWNASLLLDDSREVDRGRLCRKGDVLALVAQVDVVPSSARLILRSFHSCARPMAMVAPTQGEASFLFGSDDESGSDVDVARLVCRSVACAGGPRLSAVLRDLSLHEQLRTSLSAALSTLMRVVQDNRDTLCLTRSVGENCVWCVGLQICTLGS